MKTEAGGKDHCVRVCGCGCEARVRLCVYEEQQVRGRKEGDKSSPADDEDLLSLRWSSNCWPLISSMPFSWFWTSLGDETPHLHALMEGVVAGTPLRTDMLAACWGAGKGGRG